MPELDFKVVSAEVLTYAAAPTILFKLQIQNNTAGERIQSILMRTQIRIQSVQRGYDAATALRLQEIFGEAQKRREPLPTLLWAHSVTNILGFDTEVVAELPIACTYDFEVAAAKYLYALEEGEVPLLFLFSGTVFYKCENEGGLQISQISWEKESAYRMPIRIWKDTMDHYFPNSAWMRVRKDVFDALTRYRVQHSLLTWDETLERLLQVETERER